MHSKKQAPVKNCSDLVNNMKKAKEFDQMFQQQGKKLNGVIEYCFSGMRYKVRIESEGVSIALSLLCVRTMLNDANQPEMLEYSNLALFMAQDELYLRDVQVVIEFCDKKGNFFG